MRTGQQYLDSIRDDRRVYINGTPVADVTRDAAFRGITQSIAELYDYSNVAENDMATELPEAGGLANKAFRIPRSREELADRRAAIERWARLTNGMVGRGPDHVAGFLAGFAGAPAVFDGPGGHYDNVLRFYQHAARDDMYVSYVIVPPQVDRSRGAADQESQFIQVGTVAERDNGMVVRGAQMLGTGSSVSNYLFVSCIKPLGPGDEDYALSFYLPIATPGLRFYCRPPYALKASSVYDYPLSSRFDESDALVVFDDVLVPWENVFIYRNPTMVRQHFTDGPAHVLGNTQAQIRLAVKLKFLTGLARKIAAMNRIDGIPAVQEKLAELSSIAAFIEGMIIAAEATASIDRYGVCRPNPRFLYAPMAQQAELYARAIFLLRDLPGGGVLEVPSSFHELINPETRGDISRYIHSPGVPAEERIKLMRATWDIVGSEFGGRHHQYEMFYAGASYVAKGYAYRFYGFEEPLAMVDSFLESYGLETALSSLPA